MISDAVALFFVGEGIAVLSDFYRDYTCIKCENHVGVWEGWGPSLGQGTNTQALFLWVKSILILF